MQQICKNCGEVATPVKIKPGSGGLEIGLWLLGIGTGFLLPVAIIYSIWRVFAAVGNCCPKCKQQNTMIPTDTAIGKKLLSEFHANRAEENKPSQSASVSEEQKKNCQDANPVAQNSKKWGPGKIILCVFVIGLISHAILGREDIEKKGSASVTKKEPILTTLQGWELKPTNATLKSLVKCKEDTLFYSLKNDSIMLRKNSCSGDEDTMAFYMSEQSRNLAKKNSKEILKVGATEMVIGKPKKTEDGGISVDIFIYRSKDYLAVWCMGSRSVEKTCKDVSIEIANQAELF